MFFKGLFEQVGDGKLGGFGLVTDRQLGLFIGGTLQLNVICLTINLQLGGGRG